MPRRREESGAQKRLAQYRAKRSADRTPEPFGGEAVPTVPEKAVLADARPAAEPPVSEPPAWARPRLFCIQKHAATRLHYDLRLEIGGVLRSWAVPKGPALDPDEKRLAMEVEDHPVEYADFEGIIPEGNYGAGEVIVWDRGVWLPLEDPEQTLPKGKLTFELRGYKLRGAWHLFRTKGQGRSAGKEWMLAKRPDGWAGASRVLPQESVYSGLTVEELRGGSARAESTRGELEKLGAPRRRVAAAEVKLMLAETADAAFDDPAWLFELKYDGFRALAGREDGQPTLRTRSGVSATAGYPDVARALAALPYGDLVLDGELVVFDLEGRPRFQHLQKRAQQRRSGDIQRLALELPATYCAFDLLAFEGFDLRPLPLAERKRILQSLLPKAGPLRFVDHVAGEGRALFAEIERLQLEGLVAKRASSTYRAGRSAEWLKLRRLTCGDFVVVGFTEPSSGRTGFGALHLASCDETGELVYRGRVGSGFDEAQLGSLRQRLDEDRRDTPPCRGSLPEDRGQTWVHPRLVVEVRYLDWTDEGLLRQPVFERLREDVAPAGCTAAPAGEAAWASDEGAADGTPAAAELPEARGGEEASAEDHHGGASGSRRVPFSNLGKVFWPVEGYTKGDLIDYHVAVAPFLLPYLKDRLLVLARYPDGIAGKSFFQKDAPGFAPPWVRTERVWSEDGQREIDYFVADQLESLLYVINLGTIPLHVWGSRITDLAHPDWCILDLDPKGAPFAHVVEVARAARELAEEIGLPLFAKTSGSTGLHLLVPLGRALTFEQCRQLAELLARVIVARRPEIATIVRAPAGRGGRVYVDYLQNGHGKLLASPFTVRPVPGAQVSAPLRWDEVDDALDPRAFTIRTLPDRMKALRHDPLAGVLTEQPDLPSALSRLAVRLG